VTVSINVELRRGTGELVERISVERTLLKHVLPKGNDDSYHCLGYIDPDDVTDFNEPQVARLVAELERRRDEASPAHAVQLDELAALARRADREHLRMVFVGA
jgi:hypothetical protein